MSWRAVHIIKNTDTKIKHLTNLLCKGFLRLNHLSSVEKYNPNMNTSNSLAQQVSNTWNSKATVIQKNTEIFSDKCYTIHSKPSHNMDFPAWFQKHTFENHVLHVE